MQHLRPISKLDYVDISLYKKRNIFLFESIDAESATDLIKEMLALDAEEKSLIRMFIHSPGGYMSDGFAILDTMDGLRSPVHTIIVGECCSMATFIALNGTKRFITKNSYWMGHEMHQWLQDYYTKLKDRFHYEEDVWAKLMKMYRENTKLTKEDMEKIRNGELWLNAEQCVQKGIVDKILK